MRPIGEGKRSIVRIKQVMIRARLWLGLELGLGSGL
jgi:hypothetical protein